MRLRRIYTCLIILFCLLFFPVSVLPALDLQLIGTEEDELEPGGTLRLLALPGAEIGYIEAVITDGEGGVISSARGFSLDYLEIDGWLIILGIPSTAAPGAYTAEVSGETAGTRFRERLPLVIGTRNFLKEAIALNRKMSELRSVPDPKKAEQARMMWALMNRFRPASRFHSGAFILPLTAKRVSSYFGDRRTYEYSDGGRAGAVHNGIDFAADEGTPVSAAASGEVVFSGTLIITGTTVMIEHLPGIYTLYYHLLESTVKTGEKVEQGARIGSVGSTGLVTGAHLHWEVRVSGVAVEPFSLVENALVDKLRIISSIDQAEGSEQALEP
jgi:murein DD-endopeptidase MepM/ murein hydrolase activator NlpD